MKNKKPLLITLAALVGILLLIAVSAVVLFARGGARGQDRGVPYPYEWTERRNGTVVLKLDGSAVPDGVWTAEDTGGDVVRVEAGENKNGRMSVTLLPASEGRAALAFTLRSGEEQLAEIRLTVETAERNGVLAVSVTDYGERAMQGSVSGGDAGHPYTVGTDETGSLVLHIADAAQDAAEQWSVESSDDLIVSVLERNAAEDGFDIRLGTHEDGRAEITVSGAAANLVYVFTVAAENGALRLEDSRWTESAPRPDVTDAEMDELLSGVADALMQLTP